MNWTLAWAIFASGLAMYFGVAYVRLLLRIQEINDELKQKF